MKISELLKIKLPLIQAPMAAHKIRSLQLQSVKLGGSDLFPAPAYPTIKSEAK